MNKPKHFNIGHPFYNPVDLVALNIPYYPVHIKKPMDLGTIGSKLKGGQYETAQAFESDIRLMFRNCYKLSVSRGDSVLGKQFESVFDEKWARMKQWLQETEREAQQKEVKSNEVVE